MSDGEYRQIREGAAIGSVQVRSLLAVAGPDRGAFLQGFLTNDVQVLVPGTGCYSAWLTPQGRMLTDMHVLQSGGMMLLDLPSSTAEATLDRLNQFHFSEDVTISSMGDSLRAVWLHGPLAASVLERALPGASGLGAWGEYEHRPLEFGDSAVVVARIGQLGVPGYCAYLPPQVEAGFADALAQAGAVPVSQLCLDGARIEAGYPLFGADMTEDTIPLEAGIEARAISMSKGCYVGQEVIVRVLHRGHGRVAKRLVRLRVTGERPAVGQELVGGERVVGHLTSVGETPASGIVALGYVHRDFTASGTELSLPGAVATVGGV